jgi:hypothetical protein
MKDYVKLGLSFGGRMITRSILTAGVTLLGSNQQSFGCAVDELRMTARGCILQRVTERSGPSLGGLRTSQSSVVSTRSGRK